MKETRLHDGHTCLETDILTTREIESVFSASLSGELKLRLALLRDAIERMGGKPENGITAAGNRQIRRETFTWLDRDDYDDPMSYVSVCADLGLDPQYIRDKLHRTYMGWYKRQGLTRRGKVRKIRPLGTR